MEKVDVNYRRKRATFMISDILSGASPSGRKSLLAPTVNSPDSGTGSGSTVDDVIDYSIQSPVGISSRGVIQHYFRADKSQDRDAETTIVKDALFSASDGLPPSSRLSVIRPVPFPVASLERRLPSSSCFQRTATVSTDQVQDGRTSVDLFSASTIARLTAERFGRHYVSQLQFHAAIQHAIRSAGLSRDQQSPSGIRHVPATQSIFPPLRSGVGPAMSTAAACGSGGLGHVTQVPVGDHAHTGDLLGRIKCRRNRTVFTDQHLTNLERSFERQKYLSTKERALLAARLGLSQIQVKTWYQNRRMKWKKQVLQDGGREAPTKPKGRPRKQEYDSEMEQPDSVPAIASHVDLLTSTTDKL